jgi:hypothetical protein
MPQHLWCETERSRRTCEVCEVRQAMGQDDWSPQVSAICPGDPDEGGRRGSRPRPNAPSGGRAPIRTLEMA